MSRVPRTLPALDIEFLSGYPFEMNDPEVTMPPQRLVATADLYRGSLPRISTADLYRGSLPQIPDADADAVC